MKRFALFVASISICFTSPVQAQSRIDILQILDNFLASRTAAVRCQTTSEATNAKFFSNLSIVTIRAGETFRAQNPRLSEAESTRRFKARMEAATKRGGQIAAQGCSLGRARALLKLYEMHATMSF